MKRFHLFSCEMLRTECQELVRQAPCPVDWEIVDVKYHELGKTAMHQHLAERIAAVEETTDCDAILLAMGLCAGGVVGLATRKALLVMPCVDDCVTLFMGGRERYGAYFFAHPGTYFKTVGWLGRTETPENTEAWQEMTRGYSNLAFIRTNPSTDAECEAQARQMAAANHWNFDAVDGDLTLLKRLIFGEWNERDFLILPPGKPIQRF